MSNISTGLSQILQKVCLEDGLKSFNFQGRTDGSAGKRLARKARGPSPALQHVTSLGQQDVPVIPALWKGQQEVSWGLVGTSKSSQIGELWVWCETLSQKK